MKGYNIYKYVSCSGKTNILGSNARVNKQRTRKQDKLSRDMYDNWQATYSTSMACPAMKLVCI